MKTTFIASFAAGILLSGAVFAQSAESFVEDQAFAEPTFIGMAADAPVAPHGCATFKHLPLRASVARQLKAADKCLIGTYNTVQITNLNEIAGN